MGINNPQHLCIKDFSFDSGASGSITVDPYWVIAVFRLDYPVSFDRTLLGTSPALVPYKASSIRSGGPLVITDDCVAITVSNSKTSHTKTMNAVLKQANKNYLVELLPGDWVLAWMVNDRASYDNILNVLKLGVGSANGFKSGLKFIGRLHSIDKAIEVDPASGRRASSYQMQAVGFNELDTMLHMNATLASAPPFQTGIYRWLGRLSGVNPNDIFPKGQSNVVTLINLMLNIFVGTGIGDNMPPAAKILAAGAGTSGDAPYAYVIPAGVASLLGRQPTELSKASGMFCYADILKRLPGVQSYSTGPAPAAFVPVGFSSMLGTFIPYFPEITNRSLWEVCQQFLNPAVNEMYTCLRADATGNIWPTIVIRQIPFTSDQFYFTAPPGPVGLIPKTPFSSLPRWVIHPLMVQSLRIGRSDATRINYVQVYGVSPTPDNRSAAKMEADNPPLRDDFDILRSGARTYITNMSCSNIDQLGNNPALWMGLVADWTMGMHLTLRGTLETIGIQAPVCEGDNIEFDGVVYHIEGLTHQGRIDTESGRKRFHTTFSLSNGMSADLSLGDTDVAGQPMSQIASNPFPPQYAGLQTSDSTQYDPGLTVETEQDRPVSGF